MKHIKVTNKVYNNFQEARHIYREKYKNDSEVLEHLIEIAESEGYY